MIQKTETSDRLWITALSSISPLQPLWKWVKINIKGVRPWRVNDGEDSLRGEHRKTGELPASDMLKGGIGTDRKYSSLLAWEFLSMVAGK